MKITRKRLKEIIAEEIAKQAGTVTEEETTEEINETEESAEKEETLEEEETLDEKSKDPNSRHFSASNESKSRFTKQQLAQIIREEFASVVKGK
jgi:hypothetical protein